MIFYFTATGNSLYVAKQLDSNLVSIPQIIRRQNLSFKDDAIGIVCPVFGHEMPLIVKEFIAKAKFDTPYFYIILTYGNRHAGASELAENFVKQYNIHPAYINTVLMVDNFLPAFDIAQQTAIDKKIDVQLSEIKTAVQQRKHYIQPVTDKDRAAHQEFLSRSSLEPVERWRNLYVINQDKCIRCGICTKVCPTNCWTLTAEKPVYKSDNCQGCMACIHACPQKAIQFNIPEKNPNARYRNEHISLAEIIRSNNQNN